MWATATVVLLYSWYTTKIYFAKHKINGIPKILDSSLIEEPRWSEMSVGPRVPPPTVRAWLSCPRGWALNAGLTYLLGKRLLAARFVVANVAGTPSAARS